MSILDFDGFLIWVWMGFGLVFARLFPHTAYERTGEQPRHRCYEYRLRVNKSNNNPLTYVSDKTMITTNILAGTVFPLRQCSFKLLSKGDHCVNKNNHNPLTYVSDETMITTSILAEAIFPLRQCSFKLVSDGDHAFLLQTSTAHP